MSAGRDNEARSLERKKARAKRNAKNNIRRGQLDKRKRAKLAKYR